MMQTQLTQDYAPAAAPATRACPFCNVGGRPWNDARDLYTGISDQRFAYDRCSACGTIYLSRTPEDIQRYYDDIDYQRIPESEADLAESARIRDELVSFVSQFASGRRLLD